MKFAIIASRFNAVITERLVQGAIASLTERGVAITKDQIFWVPGALEIPITAQRLAKSRTFDAVICVGAVIKGSTDHYEHVSREVHQGIMRVSLDANLPITLGVLTVENMAQAFERAGGTQGNVGAHAAQAAFDLLKTLQTIEAA